MPADIDPSLWPGMKKHLSQIWARSHPGKLRLVGLIEMSQALNGDLVLDFKYVPVCARSEGCAACRLLLDEQKRMGRRLIDLGLLSKVEVNRVWVPKPTPPTAA